MQPNKEWKDGRCKDITFIVTKDCQLACKYCYLVGKNGSERMSWETAQQAVNYILSNENDELFDFQSVVFNFIGGEPFLEIELIDQICDYLKMQMYLRNHHWFNSYRFSITTNGINYDNPKVQNFIRKNQKHLSITITIDGNQQKHDINRVWRSQNEGFSGRGSYSDVVRNIPLWLKQFPEAATKVTISSPDIPYIKDSVLHLFNLGIKNVHINCVFENVWKEGDDLLFENQLRLLADEIINRRLFEDYECTLFDESIGQPMDYHRDRNWCGAGLMLAVDAKGNFYPCTRFAKYALREKDERIIGNIDNGVNKNLVRPFYSLSRSIQSSTECLECDVATGCAWCQGENYDCSDSGTIFQRSVAICKMHKARVRANNYFWNKIRNNRHATKVANFEIDNKSRLDKNIESPDTVIVLLSNLSTSFCLAENHNIEEVLMPIDNLHRVIKYSKDNNMSLHFIFPSSTIPDEYIKVINSIPHKKIVPVNAQINGDVVVLNNWCDITNAINKNCSYLILRISFSDFYNSIEELKSLLVATDRLDIIFKDENEYSQFDEDSYRKALYRLSGMLIELWNAGHRVSVNLVTDRLQLSEMCNCDAGWRTITVAPNGNFYVCPSFYYTDKGSNCGNVFDGLELKNPLLYKLNHSPLCKDCGAFHCSRCVYLNKKLTLEINTPSFGQCKKAELELEATRSFYSKWKRQESI